MLWDVLWRVVSMLATSGSPDLAAVAGSTLLGVLVVAVLRLVRPAATADGPRSGYKLRDQTIRVGVPRHRDPDAPGRTRPRGPTGDPAVA